MPNFMLRNTIKVARQGSRHRLMLPGVGRFASSSHAPPSPTKLIPVLDDTTISFDSRLNTLECLLQTLEDHPQTQIPSRSLEDLHKSWLPFIGRIDLSKYDTQDIKSQPLASLWVHYFTAKQDYDQALKAFDAATSHGLIVDQFSCELLAFHLLSDKRLGAIYQIVLTLRKQRYPYMLSPLLLDSWLTKLLEQDDFGTLEELLFMLILPGRMTPSYAALDSMVSLFARNLKFTALGNVIAYEIARMRGDGFDNTTISHFRHDVTMLRFNGYVAKLGASRVISNGMFHTFAFATSRLGSWSARDFPQLVQRLVAENPKLDYDKCIKLIEMMHGHHLQPSPDMYSSLLHPDVQLMRICEDRLKRYPKDEEAAQQLAHLKKAMRGNPAAKFGKPKKQSTKYRERKVSSSDKFLPLPFCIMLKVISESSNDLALGLRLSKAMIKKYHVKMTGQAMNYLLRIFANNPSALPQFPAFYEGFQGSIHWNKQMVQAVLSILLKLGDPDEFYTFAKKHRKSHTISEETFQVLKDVLGGNGDDRYRRFEKNVIL